MPHNPKLTWQPGTKNRAGRWKKKYKGKTHYFSGGRGKSDREAYDSALAAWEKKKIRIDAAAPKRHQSDYERTIEEWEFVLAWCNQPGQMSCPFPFTTSSVIWPPSLSYLFFISAEFLSKGTVPSLSP